MIMIGFKCLGSSCLDLALASAPDCLASVSMSLPWSPLALVLAVAALPLPLPWKFCLGLCPCLAKIPWLQPWCHMMRCAILWRRVGERVDPFFSLMSASCCSRCRCVDFSHDKVAVQILPLIWICQWLLCYLYHFYHTKPCRVRYCHVESRLSVRPSVLLWYCDHIGYNSWKIISRLISRQGSLLFADPNTMDVLERDHPRISAGTAVGYGKSGSLVCAYKPEISHKRLKIEWKLLLTQ